MSLSYFVETGLARELIQFPLYKIDYVTILYGLRNNENVLSIRTKINGELTVGWITNVDYIIKTNQFGEFRMFYKCGSYNTNKYLGDVVIYNGPIISGKNLYDLYLDYQQRKIYKFKGFHDISIIAD